MVSSVQYLSIHSIFHFLIKLKSKLSKTWIKSDVLLVKKPTQNECFDMQTNLSLEEEKAIICENHP